MQLKIRGSHIVAFFTGLVLSFLFTFFTHLFPRLILFKLVDEKLIISDCGRVLIIVITGIFGGLLYSIQNRKLDLPYSSGKVINLGVIADCLIGIGGALVLFIVLPGDVKGLDFVKLSATSLIGGYGGRSLLDQALDGIVKNLQEVEKNQKETQEKLKEDIARDANTLKLLSRYLDKSLELSEDGKKELKNNIKLVSATARTYIFEKTQSEFYKLRGQPKEQVKKKAENALEIFKALSDSDKDKNNDRYPAPAEMLNPDTKLYIYSYTNSLKSKIVSMTSSPQTNEHN